MLISDPSGKDGPALVLILHTLISPILNNSPTHSSLSFLSYKSIFLPLTPGLKKPIAEIEGNNDVDSDIEIQPLSPQQSLQSAL